MALYRHTSTGFLGDFASNPGAGYTAISAMPTDTVANRVAWWRALDTFGQTSSWHPSVTRDPQDPGEATISIQFSQDVALISSEPDGTITNPRDPTNAWYVGATTEVRVYRGMTDVTLSEGWTLTKVEEGCTSTLTATGGLYTLKITDIPLLATNAGYVRITATRTGSGTFTKDFRFLKVFQGQDGSSGTVIDLSNEAHTVPTDADGNNGVYTGATTTASLFIGSTEDSANWTWTATPSSGVTGTATNSNRTYTVSAMSVDVGTVTFTANKTGEAQRTAVFTISKAKGGVAYSLDVSAGSISKSKAGAYNPASLTLTASKITTSGVTAYAGRMRIQTQATLGGVWTTVYSSASDETTTTYSVPANIVAIKAMLYLAGGFTSMLDQESVPVVFDGQDGSSGIILDLDNENQTVAAAKDGTWISGTTATTTARLYLGATQLTSGITWSVQSATTGITYATTNNTSSYTVTVTNMTAALTGGTLTIAAVYNGVTYTQVFTISKANAGEDGTPATVYWLQTSASAIGKSASGVYNPTSLTLNAYAKTGTNAVTNYTGRFVIQTQATLNGGWTTRYSSLGNESSTTYSVPASIVAIRAYLYEAGGTTTLLDQETVPVVSDGANAVSYTVVLTNEYAFVPFLNGNGSYADTATSVIVYSGLTEIGTSPGSEWFEIIGVTGFGITPGGISGPNVGVGSAMTGSSATIDVIVAIKDSTGATKDVVKKVQTITRTENGALVRLITSAPVLKINSSGTNYDPAPTLNLVTANVTGTPTWQFRRTTAAGAGSWTSAGSPTLPWTLDFSPNGASWIAATTAMEYRVTVGGITDQITLPVVRDTLRGERGSRQIVITGTSEWADATAWDGILSRFGGTNPVLSDLVTIVNTSAGTSTSKFCTSNTSRPGSWTTVTEYINGNLLVTGTVGANAIAANAITAGKIAAGSITADRLVAGTITAASGIIADAAITTAKIANATITDAKLTGTLSASRIAAGTINADMIVANAITTAKINGSAVTTDKIGASAVTKTYAGSNTVTNSVTKGTAIQIFSQPITASSGELGPVLLSISVSAVNPNPARYFYIKCIIQSNDGFSFYQEGSVPPGANAYALTVPMTIVQNPNGQSSRTYTFYVQFEDGVSGAMYLTRTYSAAALLLQR